MPFSTVLPQVDDESPKMEEEELADFQFTDRFYGSNFDSNSRTIETIVVSRDAWVNPGHTNCVNIDEEIEQR